MAALSSSWLALGSWLTSSSVSPSYALLANTSVFTESFLCRNFEGSVDIISDTVSSHPLQSSPGISSRHFSPSRPSSLSLFR
ncbi:hypothetical protein GDO81_000819 [Engystomops pustulosus]|uniref:Secreted protein n=1 Tax=Engystomops pustulosus TaxID=76066 RepID=A0AAV7D931_ENGPU|nr:hypothetical protein GDO81_000819 [Engystomops pustulosus]